MTPRQSTEPGTEAGRRMVEDVLWNQRPASYLAKAIRDIEAEARASLLAAVREGVEGLPPENYVMYMHGDGPCVRSCHEHQRAAVLALLDTLSDEQETGR